MPAGTAASTKNDRQKAVVEHVVEPSITKANTVISLETCYLQINRNWFAVIGNLQNTR